ncbi:Uncharacterised protein [Vibrio cholerae]|nr:Uncharacterised protein [Vibrio cholerae]
MRIYSEPIRIAPASETKFCVESRLKTVCGEIPSVLIRFIEISMKTCSCCCPLTETLLTPSINSNSRRR